jgi:hypothetical protein
MEYYYLHSESKTFRIPYEAVHSLPNRYMESYARITDRSAVEIIVGQLKFNLESLYGDGWIMSEPKLDESIDCFIVTATREVQHG